MKIGFAARWSPLDKRSWSGISYYTYQEIQKQHEVEIFTYKLPKLLREFLTTQKSLYKKFSGKHTSVEFLTAYAKYLSRRLTEDLKKRPVDLLFVSASPQLIAFVKTDIPIVLMTDATFQQIQGYYPYFSNLSGRNLRQGIELDKKAFLASSHLLLTSEWCKQSAVKDYGVDPERISVVRLGANIDTIPVEKIRFESTGCCRLLFLGVEWERKGGDIVLETFRILQQQGMQVQLYVIGCNPPVSIAAEKNIIHIPFLDKNKKEDMDELQKIFLQTDFLFLPTRAECAGVVFGEASSFGIPSITTDTGGVSTQISDGVNGYALSYDARAQDYAAVISRLFNDPQKLMALKKTSRLHYESKLNWQQWGAEFNKVAHQLVNKPRQA
jgi:glycosyltransferase involved in cell wall biosynthesis